VVDDSLENGPINSKKNLQSIGINSI